MNIVVIMTKLKGKVSSPTKLFLEQWAAFDYWGNPQ
jgi:hypothetical protein